MHTQSIALTGDVLPPDVGTRVAELQRLDDAEGQTRAVTAMLSHARTGLLAAIAAHDLPQIVEFKAKAAAIQEIAKQVRLGKDMQLDAAEFVRRAERGLGVAIREGQANGTVADRGTAHRKDQTGSSSLIPSAKDFISDSYEIRDAYAMTDNVSDIQFDEAIAEAKGEGNLSRANVARKCKAMAESGEASGDLKPSDIVRLAREIPAEPGRRAVEVASEKFGVSARHFTRIKKIVDAADDATDESLAEYAAWLVNDLDAGRTSARDAERKLDDFIRNIDADAAPNPDSLRRPFKKSDTEMLAEIAGTLDDFAQIITWVRADRIEREDADELTQRARKAIRAINSKLKEISK